MPYENLYLNALLPKGAIYSCLMHTFINDNDEYIPKFLKEEIPKGGNNAESTNIKSHRLITVFPSD